MVTTRHWIVRALGRTLALSVIAAASLPALIPASASALSGYTWSGQQGPSSGQSVLDKWSQNNWTTPFPTTGQPVGTIVFPDLGNACTGNPATACYQSLADVTGINANALTIDDIAPYVISADSGISLGVGGGGLTATPAPSPTAATGFEPRIGLPLALTANQTWSVTGDGTTPAGLILNTVTGSGATLGASLSNQAGLSLHSFDVGPFTATGANASYTGFNAALNGTIQAADLNGTDGQPVSLADVRYDLDPNLNPNLPHTASIGPLSSAGALLLIGDGYAPDGVLSVAGGVTLDSATQTLMFIDQSGSSPSTDYSQLTATGPVALGGLLSLDEGATSGSGAYGLGVGGTATLISTSGTISGTFRNAPNGAIVPLTADCTATQPSALAAQITYSTHAVTATILSGSAVTPVNVPPAVTPVTVTAHGTAHVGVPRLTGTTASVPVSCSGTAPCTVQLSLTVTETIKNGRVIAVAARRTKTTTRHITVARARVTIQAGRRVTVGLRLNAAGRRLLAQRHRLAARLSVGQLISGKTRILSSRTLTFAPAAKHKRKHGK